MMQLQLIIFIESLSLEALDRKKDDLLNIYLQEKNTSFELIEETQTNSFVSLKLIKKKNEIKPFVTIQTI